jgi:hypothetical protein
MAVAAKVLRGFEQDPFPYLDEAAFKFGRLLSCTDIGRGLKGIATIQTPPIQA